MVQPIENKSWVRVGIFCLVTFGDGILLVNFGSIGGRNKVERGRSGCADDIAQGHIFFKATMQILKKRVFSRGESNKLCYISSFFFNLNVVKLFVRLYQSWITISYKRASNVKWYMELDLFR